MNKLTILSLISCLILASTGSAQVRPGYNGRDLESRVTDLEIRLEQTNRRLERLERQLLQPPVYEEREDVSCMLIDTGYQKAFLGTGRTKLDAEVNVRQACTSGSFNVGRYCSGEVKCSTGFKKPAVNGYVCVVTDSGYSKVYKADGKNEIEAEVKVRQACTSGSFNVGRYCSDVPARCEAF